MESESESSDSESSFVLDTSSQTEDTRLSEDLHAGTGEPNSRKFTTTRKSFFARHSVKGTLQTIFHGKRRPRPQPHSRFFSLPLELRHEVYTYIFASSMIHERTKNPLSDWDHLLLSCRQARMEMEALPAQPIIKIVKAKWANDFPSQHSLQIDTVYKGDILDKLVVAVPRALFQSAYRDDIGTYIPDYICPLFSIYTNTLVLKIHNDDTPLVKRRRLHLYEDVYLVFLALLWARDPRFVHIVNVIEKLDPVPKPPTRNFVNAKNVCVSWEGAMSRPIRLSRGMCWWLKVSWYTTYPVSWRLGMRRSFKFVPVENGKSNVEAVIWKSNKRFRR